MSSIAPADVNDAATADASEGSIAGADDEDEDDGLSFSEDFFSSLLRFLNGETDEKDKGIDQRDNCRAAPATRSFFRDLTTSDTSPTGETSTASTFGSERSTSRESSPFSSKGKT
ncbi:uncharacterized protein MONOS_9153 [Monocercomonoides exilis]|uniref:uncharacterized protein n=1 Tax=Monocercomonoides exilis TaxID=2049356 RepID=UPI00355A038B|nr:hypothetical protein MONOS_9153 [Monocercomonoides exilis]|eukprot:MONOS_9153.1-p1 / transcript=MONOS_9153.1 / gene=MONOS_9153 / organism=Monocercomonoides_exilis_PA203 / gene_product=unspecified product / transcript_product=unspecified product / location=Mono_scaffold00369:12367-12711(+) / protein_length=115 / sequence_SO=supercontig / SO=protein_coding / is_pseudo=false